MTPSEELAERLRPQVRAVIDAAELPWWKKFIIQGVAPFLVKIVIEIFLANYGATLAKLLGSLLGTLVSYLNAEGQAQLEFAQRLLNQSPLTYDAAVRLTLMPRGPAPVMKDAA